MTTLEESNSYGEDLERITRLRTLSISVKILENVEDIPEEAVRPEKDQSIHIVQCQAFAMSRREGTTIAMLKEDNWYFAPLIAYGLVDPPDDEDIKRFSSFLRFERGKYIGIVTAPLIKATFEPDIILIYSNTPQLRNMLYPSHVAGKEAKVNSHFFPPSCS